METNKSARFIYSDLSIIEKNPNYAGVVMNATIWNKWVRFIQLLESQSWVFPSTALYRNEESTETSHCKKYFTVLPEGRFYFFRLVHAARSWTFKLDV